MKRRKVKRLNSSDSSLRVKGFSSTEIKTKFAESRKNIRYRTARLYKLNIYRPRFFVFATRGNGIQEVFEINGIANSNKVKFTRLRLFMKKLFTVKFLMIH